MATAETSAAVALAAKQTKRELVTPILGTITQSVTKAANTAPAVLAM
jgi:hypothetical protein